MYCVLFITKKSLSRRHTRISAQLSSLMGRKPCARKGKRSGERMENYPYHGASPGLIHSVALRLCVGHERTRSSARAVLGKGLGPSQSTNVLISNELTTEVRVSI